MQTQLRQAMSHVEVTEPSTAGGLQVFGLRWPVPDDLVYLTLDEALKAKTLEVTEVDEHGSVPELRVINHGGTMVFLMAGEQLIGAKQNRVLNASMMMPADSKLPVPVSCVEQGRWGYQSRRFRGAASSSHALLNKMVSRHCTEAYRDHGRPDSDQGDVWNEVSRKLRAMGSRSPSAALQQAYVDRDHDLSGAIARIRLPDDCQGAAFAFGGRLVGLELFDKPATLTKLLPKLVKAYMLDAMEQPEKKSLVHTDTVAAWLRSAADLPAEPFDSPGIGTDLRIDTDKLIGASLLVEDRPVHTELFSDED